MSTPRDEFLRRLQVEGDKMAEKLAADHGIPVEFELRPSRLRGEPECCPACNRPPREHAVDCPADPT